MLVAELFPQLNKSDKFDPKIKTEDHENNYSKVTLERIRENEKELVQEIETRKKLLEEREDRRSKVIYAITDSIMSHTIEPKHENWILSIIEKWMRWYKQDEKYALKLSNFLINKLTEFQPTARAKAVICLKKIISIRRDFYKCTKEYKAIPNFDNSSHFDIFDRYLPPTPRPYFDSLEDGWCIPLTQYKSYDNSTPFERAPEEMHKKDILYQLLIDPTHMFIRGLFETMMHDLGVKEDSHIINNSSRK